MYVYSEYTLIMLVASVAALVLNSYILPNGGSVLFSYFTLLVSLSVGVFPLLCGLVGSMVAS